MTFGARAEGYNRQKGTGGSFGKRFAYKKTGSPDLDGSGIPFLRFKNPQFCRMDKRDARLLQSDGNRRAAAVVPRKNGIAASFVRFVLSRRPGAVFNAARSARFRLSSFVFFLTFPLL